MREKLFSDMLFHTTFIKNDTLAIFPEEQKVTVRDAIPVAAKEQVYMHADAALNSKNFADVTIKTYYKTADEKKHKPFHNRRSLQANIDWTMCVTL